MLLAWELAEERETRMSPSRIMIIRHAEKPVPDGAPGIAPDGSPDPKSLSEAGWERAGKLVATFSQPTVRHIETPDAVFAASPEVGSKRPAETVTPLVHALWPAPERAQRFERVDPAGRHRRVRRGDHGGRGRRAGLLGAPDAPGGRRRPAERAGDAGQVAGRPLRRRLGADA